MRIGAATRAGRRVPDAAAVGVALLLVPAATPGAPGWTGASGPALLQAQEQEIEVGGLVRTGLRLEPAEAGRGDGFEVYDARAALRGGLGLVFDVELQGEFDAEADRFRLLDARLTVPFRPEANLSVGQFKAPFGREQLLSKADIPLVERSLATRALTPGRQVGAELHGRAAESRLAYRAGVFNGNGRRARNDDNRFLYAARVHYNTVGEIEFYDDVVVEVGGNLAFSRDEAAPLGPGVDGRLPAGPPPDFAAFRGDRFVWGLDLRVAHRGFGLEAEYLRADLEARDEEGTVLSEWAPEGGYVQASYTAWGALQALARWDFFTPALGPDRDFLVLGVNADPGFHARLGIQLALGLDGSPPGHELADGQVLILTQFAF